MELLYAKAPTRVDENWTTIPFPTAFTVKPVIVAADISTFGIDPIVVRMKQVTQSGFNIALQEEQSAENDIDHIGEVIGYLAVTPGPITNANGVVIGEAGFVQSAQQNRDQWFQVNMQNSYLGAPVVIMSILSANGLQPFCPRVRQITKYGFQYQMSEWSYMDGVHQTETLGYVVIEPGTHRLADGTLLIAGKTAAVNKKPTTVQLNLRFDQSPVVVAQVQTVSDATPVTTRIKNVTQSAFDVYMQEEERADQIHAEERIGYLALGQSAAALNGQAQKDAVRFLAQAGFGGSMADVMEVASKGYEAWLNEQFTQPVSLTKPYMDYIYTNLGTVTLVGVPGGPALNVPYMMDGNNTGDYGVQSQNLSTAWMRNIVHQPDQLRQRVTWALSQIFVTSIVQNFTLRTRGGQIFADYYDTLAKYALGNFGDLLEAVTMHPLMADYLSHLGNEKADPSINRYPDENYAREVMQLFSIGLWELNVDGTRKVDSSGAPIPTYDNNMITEMARVFTGLWIKGQPWQEGFTFDHTGVVRLMNGLQMFEARHDQNAKVLFRGKPWQTNLPANNGGMKDIRAALTLLFNHPNTPPFISKALIQFLVTSNPSPAYVSRVAQVFINNGQGKRGDLFAVVKAILLDTEARNLTVSSQPQFGKLQEPMVRLARLIRAFDAGCQIAVGNATDLQFWIRRPPGDFNQWPMYSPSVFNFFQPGYRHRGILSNAGLSSPEFQILQPVSATASANELAQMIDNLIHVHPRAAAGGLSGPPFAFNFRNELAVAHDSTALIERLNLLLCNGQMSSALQQRLTEAIQAFPVTQREDRVKVAVWLTAVAPDAAILQ